MVDRRDDFELWRRDRHRPALQQERYVHHHLAPPFQAPIPQREFTRHDYSHDRPPRTVPHVFEYEHGNMIRNVHLINPPPVPIVLNSASQNPELLENYRRLSVAGGGLNPTTFNDFMRQNTLCNNVPGTAQRQFPLNTAHQQPPLSQNTALIDKLQAELAETRAELLSLKKGGNARKRGGNP